MHNVPSFGTCRANKTKKLDIVNVAPNVFALGEDGHFATCPRFIFQERIFIVYLASNDGLDGSLQFCRVESPLNFPPKCDAMLDFLEYRV
jgi:hypothetical protein